MMKRVNDCMRGAACVLALTLAGAVPAVAADVRTVTVRAKEFTYEPSTIRVEAGQEVRLRLVNAGRLSHNLHLHGAGLEAHTGTIQSEASDTITFTAPEDGTVAFFCKVPGHRQAGMEGKLVTE